MKKLLKRVIAVILLLSLLTASGLLFSSCEKNGTPSESGYASASSEEDSDLSADGSSDSAAEDSSSGDGAEESGSGGGLVNGGNYQAH